MILEELKTESRTMILYEAPHHLIRTLEELYAALGERRITLCRELTKKFEQTVRGTVAEVLEHFRTTEPKGEFVIVLAGKPKPGRETQGDGAEQKIGYDE